MNELQTGIFWNNSMPAVPESGTRPATKPIIAFSFAALPVLAQIAPAFGVQAADFDGDGHLDLAVAQNFFSPQRETGRMDGGLSRPAWGRPPRLYPHLAERERPRRPLRREITHRVRSERRPPPRSRLRHQ